MKLPALLQDRALAFAIARGQVDCDLLTLSQPLADDGQASARFTTYLKFARDGSPYAMCMCSRAYRAGVGVQKSNKDAFAWAERAAALGFAPAFFELGSCYELGDGVPVDIGAAHKHFEQASQLGFGAAAYHLAKLCCERKIGGGVLSAIEYARR